MSAQRQSKDLPDTEAAELSRAGARELSRLLAENTHVDRARIRLDDRDLILPREAISLLRDLLTEMAQGNAVTVVPTHAQLTTQEAATLLNVSRPYVVRLLEEGHIPFTKVGTHRRIRYQDLMAYKQQRDEEAAAALDELVAQAQEHDLGY